MCTCITKEFELEGDGDVLFVVSKLSSEQDFNGRIRSGTFERIFTGLLESAGFNDTSISVGSSFECACAKSTRARGDRYYNPQNYRTIIALGDDALYWLTGRRGIADKRGQEYPLHKEWNAPGVNAFTTYDPWILRNAPTFRRIIVADLSKALASNRVGGVEETIEWQWWDGQELPDSPIYSFDIETIDEKGNYTELATQCAVAGKNFCYVSRPTPSSALALSRALNEKIGNTGAVLVGHNSWQFDIPKTNKAGAELPLGEDTMVLAYLEDETQPKGLEGLCVKHLGIKGWKDEFSHPLGSDGFALYNARDVVYTLRLYEKLLPIVGNRKKIADLILRPAQEALLQTSNRGIFIDDVYVSKVRYEAQDIKEISKTVIVAVAKELGFDQFNPGSTRQVGALLDKLDVAYSLTATGQIDTSTRVLETIDHPVAKEILRYRGAVKTLSTYCSHYEKLKNTGDGRVHPQFSLTRTVTGRSAAKDENTQNLTRELKGFLSAAPGHELVSVDWNAIEFRIAAWVAQEEGILKRFAENPLWDPHRYFAAMFYDKPESEITKAERQVAKSANFGLLYMSQADGLKNYAQKMGIELDISVCERLKDLWHDTFPGFKAWYMLTKRMLEKYSYVETATGRRRNYGDYKMLYPHKRMAAIREAVNVQVQSLAADVAYVTLAELHRKGYPLVNFVHDSFSFEFVKGQFDSVVQKDIRDTMCLYPRVFFREYFGFDLDVPLEVEFTC